eukprot:UN03630
MCVCRFVYMFKGVCVSKCLRGGKCLVWVGACVSVGKSV